MPDNKSLKAKDTMNFLLNNILIINYENIVVYISSDSNDSILSE